MKGFAGRRGPYTQLSRLWPIIIASLAIDPLLATYATHRVPAESASRVAILCALLTLPFLNQPAIRRLITKLRNLHRVATTKPSRMVGALIIASIILPLAAKLLLIPRANTLVTPLVLALVAYGVIATIRSTVRQNRDERKRLEESPASYVTQWESQVIAVSLLPMLAARAISLCGVFSEASTESPLIALGYTATSALLLLIMKPRREFFIGTCKRCKRPVPAAFEDYGSCPLCDETLAGG